MTIFDLHAGVLSDYRDFVRSFILIADERAREFVNQALAGGRAPLARAAGATEPSVCPRVDR